MTKFCKMDVVAPALSLTVLLVLGMAGGATARGLSLIVDEAIEPPDEFFTINMNDVTFGGNGCPTGTVQVVPSPDERTVSILFDDYTAATETGDLRERRSCNMALPVRVPNGISLGIVQVDYRGFASVPDIEGAYARMRAEYFWAGQLGPVRDTKFEPGFDDDFLLTDNIVGPSIVFSPCGQDVNFRINTSLEARKTQADTGGEEVEITVDTSDIVVTGVQMLPFFECRFLVRPCSI